MELYDLAYIDALTGAPDSTRIGFKKIYVMGKDVRLTDVKSPRGQIPDSICMGNSGDDLVAAAKASPSAIIIRDSRIDRKLIDVMRSKEIMLCVPFDMIMESYGLKRSSKIYMTSKLVKYAMKKKIEIAFVTLAQSKEMLCSSMQLIALARLLGVSDAYARKALSENNRRIVTR